MDNLKYIIESLLFVAEGPLTVNRISRIVPGVEKDKIQSALDALGTEYDERQGGFYLREVAGGFQLCTRPEHNQWIKRLIQPKAHRLSKAALETLATIAYKQPIIRSDIEHIRGVDCGGILRNLLERNLIRVMGRKDIPGRPLIYGTTKHFLTVFDLKNLNDLPTPKEIESLRANAAETDQLFMGLPQNDPDDSPVAASESEPGHVDEAATDTTVNELPPFEDSNGAVDGKNA